MEFVPVMAFSDDQPDMFIRERFGRMLMRYN